MSDFGKGFTYCIGLFLKHAEKNSALWFVAADHLFELKIPKNFVLKEECKLWRNKCLDWRLKKCSGEDKNWAIEQAQKFLMEWDRQNNIPVEKGKWE